MQAIDRVQRRQGGFTLIEILISLVIFSLVMVTVYSIYTNSAKAFFSQENSVQLNQGMRAGVELVSWEIRMAGFIDTEASYATMPGFSAAVPSTSLQDTVANDPGRADADTWNTDDDSVHFTLDVTHQPDGVDDDGDGETDEADELLVGPDGDTLDDNEDIAYYLRNGVLYRRARSTMGNSSAADDKYICRPVLENVTDFQLQYFDIGGNEIVAPWNDDKRGSIREVALSVSAETAKRDPLSHDFKDATLTQRIRVRNAGLLDDLENKASSL
jgi:prepilin-type N-terminal cleavage/methylation domain-containing protein